MDSFDGFTLILVMFGAALLCNWIACAIGKHPLCKRD
jgi:hypothetical protein